MDIRKFFSSAGPTSTKRTADEPKKQVEEKSKPKQPGKTSKDPAKQKAPVKSTKKPTPVKSPKKEKNNSPKPPAPKEKKESGKKSRQRIVTLSSDSEDEEPITKKPKKQARESRKVVSDSDDDEPAVSKPAAPKPEPEVKPASPKKKPANKVNGKQPAAQKLVPVSADDFFASSTPASKLSLKAAQARKVSSEKESHDDEDFQKTLEKLDEKKEDKRSETRTSPRKSSKAAESPAKKKAPPPTTSPTKRSTQQPKPEAAEKADKKRTPEKRKAETSDSSKEPGSAASKKAEKVATPKKESPRKASKKAHEKTPSKPVPKKEKPAPAKKEEVPEKEKPAPAATAANRRGNAASYQSYLNREGPRLLGTRDIPEGTPGCLNGVTVVMTGVLECIERDDAKALLERCGAKVTGSISRKTTYLIAGRDSGPAKIRKAEECKVKILEENELYELIESFESSDDKSKAKKSKVDEEEEQEEEEAAAMEEERTPRKKRKAEPEASPQGPPEKKTPMKKSTPSPTKRSGDGSAALDVPSTSSSKRPPTPALMWVDKYRPQTTKQIIGQQGDKSNCAKLLLWLRNWYKSRAGPKKPLPKWGGGGGDGSAFKAALLSGSPGVGKTTTATLAAKEAGYSILEMNASDTRSKKSLKEEVAEMLGNLTLTGAGMTSKHVLIMDEVDGMAGNQDRGGVQELIALIKTTRIPIVCICNDRSHPKMRSLVNYCFDLRFPRPQVKQIQAALMSVACKEGLTISPAVVQEIVMASNQDVRQALHNLSLWSSRTKSVNAAQVKADAGKGTKDIRLGPFDVVRKILCSSEGGASMNLNEKAALFFHDYNMVPLFVQDNYLNIQPLEAKGDRQRHLLLVSEAAESISYGDLIERQIRQNGSWSLLPMQAFFSSVLPGELVRGHMREMVTFPAWFGKNSSTNKRHRLLKELKHHMHTRVSADRTQLSMDYVRPLLNAVTQPLINRGADGVPTAVEHMQHYFLQRADLESLSELAQWPGSRDPMALVDSKVKAALTRALNKEGFMTPYATDDVIVKKKGKKVTGKAGKSALQGDEEAPAEEEEEEDEEPDPTLVDYD
ncbi:germ line transcription factor 1 isoform X2 [Haemaphysalis longicornis]